MILDFLRKQLNDEQYAAASHVHGPSLILAGAGSGKTRVLTYKIANLVYTHQVHPRHILAVTFTNKAANEMKERIHHIQQQLISEWLISWHDPRDMLFLDEELPQISSPIYAPHDYQRVGTFHSICLKILKRDIETLGMQYSKSFWVYDAGDSKSIAKKTLKDLNLTEIVELNDMKGQISRRKNEGYLPAQAGYHCQTQRDERILKAYNHYQQALETANMLDFDDLLLLTKTLFDRHPDILRKRQEQFHHILVDEAQDTNAIQFGLMKALAPADRKPNIDFIGDDYQSIYRRRGALMEQFLNIKSMRPSVTIYKLQTNYRSLPHIVEAGNAIIKKNAKQYDKSITAHRTGNQHIRIFEYASEQDEAIQTIDRITKIKEENNKQRAHFTILYRTNAQSQPFESVLLTEWIPYKVIGAQKFFERAEIKDILSYIKWLINHHDDIALKRIINVPKRNIWAASVDEVEQYAVSKGISLGAVLRDFDKHIPYLKSPLVNKMHGFLAHAQAIRQLIDLCPPAELLKQIFDIIKYREYIIKLEWEEKGEDKIANIWQLINMAEKREEKGMEGLRQFMDEVSLMTSVEDAQTDDSDAIRLMTVHASKGLEFPYVFIVGCEDGIFPLEKAKFDDDEMEEERRGMYVAITRAKDQLFLSYAGSRYQRWNIRYNRPSRFLEELPDHLVKHYNLSDATPTQKSPSFEEGDIVTHKLYGRGMIIESYQNTCIVKFDNPMVNMRKIDSGMLKRV
jgi:DNA helicase-2/ATP-dependent DNA helicase PcrA